MEKIYFANKIIKTGTFLRHGYWHDYLVGCDFENQYYLDSKIYSFKMVDGKYLDEDGNEYVEFLIPDEDRRRGVIFCEKCENYGKTPASRDCTLVANYEPRCVGITHVALLTNHFENYSLGEAKRIIARYNSDVNTKPVLIGSDIIQLKKDTESKVRRFLKENK